MDHRDTWETYAAAWRTTDPAARLAHLHKAVAEDAVYRDPTIETRGHEALMAYMDTFQQMLPGGRFTTRTFASHHDRSCVEWNMTTADGDVAGVGTSFGTFGEDGRLTSMTGFFATP